MLRRIYKYCKRQLLRLDRRLDKVESLADFLNQDAIVCANVSICALVGDIRMGGGKFNEHILIPPASNMKIVTTATALELLEKDFTFSTTLMYDGKIVDGTLQGNLIIQGMGDPTLGSSYFSTTPFADWAKRLRDEFLINEITGTIVLDTSFLANELLNPQWLLFDIEAGGAAPMSALCYQDNKGDYHQQLLCDFAQALSEAGINVLDVSLPVEEKQVLFIYESPSLAEIVKITNHDSNNFYAEQLFRYLGSLYGNKPATIADSIAVVKQCWEKRGVSTDRQIICDGSGLSPQNGLSAAFLVDILQYMRTSEQWDAFFASLPVAGQSGTLTSFLRGTALDGRVHAKSGTTQRTKAYSGYITEQAEVQGVFSILVNNSVPHNYKLDNTEIAQQATQPIEELLLWWDKNKEY